MESISKLYPIVETTTAPATNKKSRRTRPEVLCAVKALRTNIIQPTPHRVDDRMATSLPSGLRGAFGTPIAGRLSDQTSVEAIKGTKERLL